MLDTTVVLGTIILSAAISAITTAIVFHWHYKKQFKDIVARFEGYLGTLDEENLNLKEENYKLKSKLKTPNKTH